MIGGTEKEISALKIRYPNVYFLGTRPYKELAKNQRAADVLVVPNIPESTESTDYTSPIKLFAHMASGVPMIVSDLPSLRAIVDDTTAFFCTPGDSQNLAESVSKIFSRPEEARGRALSAKEKSKGFTWRARADLILGALSQNIAVQQTSKSASR